MPPQGAPLAGSYDLQLVALSIVIAVLASGAALDLAGRVNAAQGRSRMAWLGGGAFVMGLGIWSMHYTGMLAFRLPVPTRYSVPSIIVSLMAAVLASNVALMGASRMRLSLGSAVGRSAVMGAGIATMHYTGMAGMRLSATMHWNPWLIIASVAIAIGVSAVALWLAFRFGQVGSDDWSWGKVGSALLMGTAIPAMHYTGMAAASFTASTEPVRLANTIGNSTLGTGAIVAGTLLVVGVAIATSIVDRRITTHSLRLQAALTEVKTLRGLLPICAHCKRIHTDKGSWEPIELYVRRNSDAKFSHGMCPDCMLAWEAATLG